MSESRLERRSVPRIPGPRSFSVLVDEQCFPAELADISVAGFQARLDAVTFDEIREKIDGVRFGNAPPLSITLHWGFFDGTFGASFNDQLMAAPVVECVVASLADTRDTVQV